MADMMVIDALPYALVVLVGLTVGSFLNVVIHRVPNGESVVRPRSRCPACGAEIAGRDNIPLLSWLLLRGKCRHCAAPISVRYPLVELLTAVLFATMLWRYGLTWELPAYLYLVAIGVALTMIDIDVHRLPDVLTLPSYPVMAVLLLAPTVLDSAGSWSDYLRAWLAALVLFVFYFVLRVAYPAGMGFGDVKLSGVLGLALGYQSWGAVVVGGFLGFALGAVGGLLLMATRKAGRKSKVPFGPYMLAGTLIALLSGGAIWDLYIGTFT